MPEFSSLGRKLLGLGTVLNYRDGSAAAAPGARVLQSGQISPNAALRCSDPSLRGFPLACAADKPGEAQMVSMLSTMALSGVFIEKRNFVAFGSEQNH